MNQFHDQVVAESADDAIVHRITTVRSAVELGSIRWADAYIDSSLEHPQPIEPGMLTPAGPAPLRNRADRRAAARQARRRR